MGKPKFLESFFSFSSFLGFYFKAFKSFLKILMYEDRTQNYDPEIHEEYLIHDTYIFPATSFIAMCTADYSIAINTTNETEGQ